MDFVPGQKRAGYPLIPTFHLRPAWKVNEAHLQLRREASYQFLTPGFLDADDVGLVKLELQGEAFNDLPAADSVSLGVFPDQSLK